VLANDIPSMNDTRNPSQNRQQNVDPEVRRAASFENYGERRDEDCEQIEADIATGRWHVVEVLIVVLDFKNCSVLITVLLRANTDVDERV